ncbi:hypothetical protein INT45_002223 [Circinella minor]|uniref:Uncharacterized protein n=1 Tax=Circinella minor TaxID=1195481 RepID=A0A8H7SFL6_9FUNG|nr:hypothetical protein INT45_002223 [Circinella minor]
MSCVEKLDSDGGCKPVLSVVELVGEEIEDVPVDWKREIDDQIGEIHFNYRNIKDVCQLLFSHPIFWKVMINQPSEFWEELQFPGNIILSIILASDRTVISGNGRHKARPLYLKLENIPMKYRNSDLYRATKTVAFLPVIDCKDGVSPPTWLSAFRVAVFITVFH